MRSFRWMRQLLVLLVLLSGTAFPAVVLPRPPSSPNYIPRDYLPNVLATGSKDYGEKALYQPQQQQQQQSTNVEKPDTRDYRFLEIELSEGENVESLDLHGLVQAVLNTQQQVHGQQQQQRRFDLIAEDETSDTEQPSNLTYPHPEVIPHSILGVRDVGLGPNQRLFEPTSLESRPHFSLNPATSNKNLGDEKLYYLKSKKPKVYVNFRGRSGNNFQEDGVFADSRLTMRLEPVPFLRATQPYRDEQKTKSRKAVPKKYDPRIHGGTTSDSSNGSNTGTSNLRIPSSATTENTVVTSSELPKQIPAPPSRTPARSSIAHTTPVQRFTLRRTDILPFPEP